MSNIISPPRGLLNPKPVTIDIGKIIKNLKDNNDRIEDLVKRLEEIEKYKNDLREIKKDVDDIKTNLKNQNRFL